MNYVFGIALLVVAAAVVVLFAMFGELYARIGGAGTRDASGGVRLLDEARIGQTPDTWPASLDGFVDADLRVLLVLSTACGSCETIAQQVDEDPTLAGADEFGVLVSTGDPLRATAFLDQHEGLKGLPYHVDVGGDWVTGELGVTTSPTALVFKSGRLVSALLFSNISVLRNAVFPIKEPV